MYSVGTVLIDKHSKVEYTISDVKYTFESSKGIYEEKLYYRVKDHGWFTESDIERMFSVK